MLVRELAAFYRRAGVSHQVSVLSNQEQVT